MTPAQLAALQPVSGPSVWRGEELADDNTWLHELNAAQRSELIHAARHWTGRDYRTIQSFEARSALPSLRPLVTTICAELAGRGFSLIRGVPVDDMTRDEIKLAYWAVGLLFGKGLTQNANADFLCPVTDTGVDFGYAGTRSQENVRGYQSKADLNLLIHRPN